MKGSNFVSASALAGLKKKIVYVDDVNYSLISLKNRIGEHYDIFPVQSVAKMLELLEGFKPDLILMDINMPGVSGYEGIKILKEKKDYADIPVIFLTSNSDRESIVKGFSLGAVDYVIKPFTSSQLIESIENQLNPRSKTESSPDEETNRKPVILVVDDVSSMLRAIQYALHDRYKVYMLSKSEDVVDFLRNKTPDLFLLDYLMPELSGFDLIPIIRALPQHVDTPIIIITTEGTFDHVNEAVSLGASDFIVKPFKPKELVEKVARHLRITRELRTVKEEMKNLYK